MGDDYFDHDLGESKIDKTVGMTSKRDKMPLFYLKRSQ
jgi:hypothetical protein